MPLDPSLPTAAAEVRDAREQEDEQRDDAKRDVWDLGRRKHTQEIQRPSLGVAAMSGAACRMRDFARGASRGRSRVVVGPQRGSVIGGTKRRDVKDRRLGVRN